MKTAVVIDKHMRFLLSTSPATDERVYALVVIKFNTNSSGDNKLFAQFNDSK